MSPRKNNPYIKKASTLAGLAFTTLFISGVLDATEMPALQHSNNSGSTERPVQHTVEASDNQTYVINNRNTRYEVIQNVMTLFYDNSPAYLRIDENYVDEDWRRLSGGDSGSFYLTNRSYTNLDPSKAGDIVVVDYRYDRSDPDHTYVELLFSTFAGKDKLRSSNDRWASFYQVLQREFGPQSNNSFGSSSVTHSNENSNESTKISLKTDRSRSLTSQFNFGKFTPKEISFKPVEVTIRFKDKLNGKNHETKFNQNQSGPDTAKPGFIEVTSVDKTLKKSDNSEKMTMDEFLAMLKDLFRFDVLELKKCLEELQKLTDSIAQEEMINLRPFYEALALLLKTQTGVDVPASPAFDDKVSPEEIEWRKQMDRLAYTLLVRERGASTFRYKYNQLFKTYVLPIKEQYNKRVAASLEEFLKQLKDLLANKSEQVIVKSTQNSTEFVIDISSPKNSQN